MQIENRFKYFYVKKRLNLRYEVTKVSTDSTHSKQQREIRRVVFIVLTKSFKLSLGKKIRINLTLLDIDCATQSS